jgi:hypothetical protein
MVTDKKYFLTKAYLLYAFKVNPNQTRWVLCTTKPLKITMSPSIAWTHVKVVC